MNCQEMRERISMRLDGELDQREARLLQEHLRVCTSCQEYEKSLIEVSGKMKLWKDEKAPASLQDKLLKRILEKGKKKTRVFGVSFGYYRIPAPVAWAAVLLFVFLAFHLVKDTFFERKVLTLETGYEMATVQEEGQVPVKISITSEDIVSTTTNYKNMNSQKGGFR